MPDFIHTFTLRQEEQESPPRNTSPVARKAYTDALQAAGFKRFASSPDGSRMRLPHSTRVGNFPTPADAKTAIRKAVAAARAADPGKFFLEAVTLSVYEPLLSIGDLVTANELKEDLRAAGGTTIADLRRRAGL